MSNFWLVLFVITKSKPIFGFLHTPSNDEGRRVIPVPRPYKTACFSSDGDW